MADVITFCCSDALNLDMRSSSKRFFSARFASSNSPTFSAVRSFSSRSSHSFRALRSFLNVADGNRKIRAGWFAGRDEPSMLPLRWPSTSTSSKAAWTIEAVAAAREVGGSLKVSWMCRVTVKRDGRDCFTSYVSGLDGG